MKNDKLADLIFERGAFQMGNFKTKSEDWIPYYFNLRDGSNPKKSGLLNYKDYNLIAIYLNHLLIIKKLRFDILTGIPFTGEKIVNAFANVYQVPRIIKLVKEEKEDGSRKIKLCPDFKYQIKYQKGEKVLLVDDVIHKGTSSIEAIEALDSIDYTVKDIAVVIDLEQGGKEILEKLGCNVYSIFKASELLPYFFRKCLNYLEKRNS